MFHHYSYKKALIFWISAVGLCSAQNTDKQEVRERVSINQGWKFYRYEDPAQADNLIYDVRPEEVNEDGKAADARPTEAVAVKTQTAVLKPFIMPTGNAFIKDAAKRYTRPEGNPGADFPFVQAGFDDANWLKVSLPHDWAINGPFYKGHKVPVGGGMGRLPIQGVAWYRKKLDIQASDKGKKIYLDVDGAMSYAMVWLNGHLVGGWPYGYASWRVDLTPYLNYGAENQLSIRIDNPLSSSRWYPGAGIYRNVWLTKTSPAHVGQWGTFVTTANVSKASADVKLAVTVDNYTSGNEVFEVVTDVFLLDEKGNKKGKPVAQNTQQAAVNANSNNTITSSFTIANPKLWGPPPTQQPNLYVAVTKVMLKGRLLDVYETKFGIRDLRFDPEKGLFVNGEHLTIKGANQHHDLGALGAAFNLRAAERQLQILRESGCNAIRLAHNPPAPELLDLADRMGFLIVDEIFDVWKLKKTSLDSHLLFPEWHEQDLRALIRRDRNHPSVIIWSFGNEVGEQYTDIEGAAVAKELNAIVKEEDTTRPTTISMNYAKPDMPLPQVVDIISLNYQGEGIRNAGAYAGLKGINTSPLFPRFHEKFPNKMIISSENAAAVSSRGEYLFPVNPDFSAPILEGNGGGNPDTQQVSSYELYTADFGSSADKVFATTDQHPFVAGGFVWSGWDYLGEPTPYYLSKSSYFGIIDLAGFKKDRFYLYQSYWLPEKPMAHILPHWNWSGREGQVTPVHVFTSGDEAELFLNGKSLGRKKKGQYEYRLRWDDVTYTPGELKVVTYKKGKKWATDVVKTTGAAYKLELVADRSTINSQGSDLSFITVKVTDKEGLVVPNAKNLIRFSIEGDGEIVATDNGDAASLVSFASTEREAFNGYCLVIVKPKDSKKGTMTVKVQAEGLQEATLKISVK